jgi:AcrR family transcriptional regulator
MGVKERHERERQAVRTAILGAARELFLTEGFRNVSMRKIAERIEYSPAAIYSYFSSKDDIFFTLAEEGFHLLCDRGNEVFAAATDPLDALRRGLWAFYEFSKAHPEYFELMFLDRSVPSLAQDIERFEFFQQTTARGEAAIRALIDKGTFKPTLDPAAALHVLWASLLGPAALGLAGRLAPGEDPDALAHDILESVLTGFRAGVTTTFNASECPLRAATHTGDVRPAANPDDSHATHS